MAIFAPPNTLGVGGQIMPFYADLCGGHSGRAKKPTLPASTSYAVACLAVTRSSRAGIGCRNFQTMLMGRLPSCETYSTGPR